jgi:3-methyladenine DNA glycosylase AlkD
MQAYMKSSIPYLGVQTPQLRQAVKGVLASYPLDTLAEWRDAVLTLWRSARYREERYAAIGLIAHSKYRPFRTLEALPIYEEIITSGAWWDFVDTIATHQLGELLSQYPREAASILRMWAVSPDIWKRRAAILAQLGFKRQTDCKLLYDCIRPSLGSTEFFLRKGIGWALREYAKTDSAEVMRYVREHESQLSSLTKREALKHFRTPPAARSQR